MEKAYIKGVKDAIREVKQLCEDYSTRNQNVFIKDVLAQLDSIQALLFAPKKDQSSD